MFIDAEYSVIMLFSIHKRRHFHSGSHAVRWAIYAFLFVFHCNYVSCLAPFP